MSKNTEKRPEKDVVQKCSRCDKEVAVVDYCPFASGINNSLVECNCCKSCRHECAMDI